MGFSLKNFFETLEFLLEKPGASDATKLALLQQEIGESKKYAQACGVIDAD